MSKIHSLKKNLSKILALIVTFLTISASTAGAVKLTQSLVSGDNEELPQVLAASDSQNAENDDGQETEAIELSDDKPAGGFVATPKITPTNSPETKKPLGNLAGSNLSTAPTTPSLSTASQNSNACVITLFGKQYDVTSLRSSHPGGDVFSCGADNTTKYQSAHGNDVSRMQPYLVNSNGGTSGNTSGNTTGGTGSTMNNYEYEDEEEEYERQKQELEDEFEQAKQELENEHEAN